MNKSNNKNEIHSTQETNDLFTEVHSHKGSYVSVEELTKSRVLTNPYTSPNQPQRRIELLTMKLHKGVKITNFPGAPHVEGAQTGDVYPSRSKALRVTNANR